EARWGLAAQVVDPDSRARPDGGRQREPPDRGLEGQQQFDCIHQGHPWLPPRGPCCLRPYHQKRHHGLFLGGGGGRSGNSSSPCRSLAWKNPTPWRIASSLMRAWACLATGQAKAE